MKEPVERRPTEYSFTLLEVIVAVGLLVAVVLEVAGGQGSLFELTDYSKKSTEATWLAKRLMSQVEYNYQKFELKDLDTEGGSLTMKDVRFEDMKDNPDFDYTYSIDIKEWKLPLMDFLTGGIGKSKEEEEEQGAAEEAQQDAMQGIPGLDGIINQIFEGHMMKVAKVEVFWPEGAGRNSVKLVYLMTNQKKLDQYLLTKTGTWDQVIKKMDPNAGQGNQGNNGNNQGNQGNNGNNQGNQGNQGNNGGNNGNNQGNQGNQGGNNNGPPSPPPDEIPQ